MAEMSKTSQNKLKNMNYVATAGESQVPDATTELAALAEQIGVDDFDPALVEQYVAAIVALMWAANDHLDQAEAGLVDELGDDAPLRAERDETRDKLRADMSETREAVKVVAKAADAKQLGLAGVTPRVPDELVTYAKNVVDQFRKRGGQLGRLGVQIDLKEAADQITPRIDRLEQIVDQLVTESREEQLARAKRDDADRRWERVYRGGAWILYGHLIMAGRDELAERLRPTLAQASGADVVDAQDPDDVDEPVTDADTDPAVEPVAE